MANLLTQPPQGALALSIKDLFGIINNGTKGACTEIGLAQSTNSTMLLASQSEAESTRQSIQDDASKTWCDAISSFVQSISTAVSSVVSAKAGKSATDRSKLAQGKKTKCEDYRSKLLKKGDDTVLGRTDDPKNAAANASARKHLHNQLDEKTRTETDTMNEDKLLPEERKEIIRQLDSEIKGHDLDINACENEANRTVTTAQQISTAISSLASGGTKCPEAAYISDKAQKEKDIALLKAASQLLGAIVGQEGRKQESDGQEKSSAIQAIDHLIQFAARG